MIHRLSDMIGSPNTQTVSTRGHWVSAVPVPFYPGLIGRLQAAWAVLKGDAHAVRWPQAGEFEEAAKPFLTELSHPPHYV